MKVIFLVLLALAATVMMFENIIHDHEREDYWVKNNKKACKCIKLIRGACLKLKCCEIYQLVPYRVLVEKCKYGPCKFFGREGFGHKIATVSKP